MLNEGEFRYTNGIVVEKNLEASRTGLVINHEFTHQQMYTKSTYGQMLMMIEKNVRFCPETQGWLDVLFKYCNRMQERVAVNIETIQECIDNGMEAYELAIEKLRSKNRTYYNYFRKLCCINGKISSSDNAAEYSNIINRLALLAMNVNLNLIPTRKFIKTEKLDQFFCDSRYNAMISPNKRFDILINVFFRNNDVDNDIDSVIDGTIDLERINDYKYINEHTLNYMALLYQGKDFEEEILKRISTVCKTQYDFEGASLLGARPASINIENDYHIKQVRDIEELVSISEAHDCKELFIHNRMGGLENLTIITSYYYENNKKNICMLPSFDNEEFKQNIDKIKMNCVFIKTKIIKNEGKVLRKELRLPIYIYAETPILNDLTFIESFFYAGKFWFEDLENKSIFCVVKRSFIYFADIVKDAKDVLISRLTSNGLIYEQLIDVDIANLRRIDELLNDFNLINANLIHEDI